MKKVFLLLCLSAAFSGWCQETVKSKALKLKYSLPQGWKAEEFGDKNSVSWEGEGNPLCHCSGILFTRQDQGGKMNVLIYPSTAAGLDSAKRNAVGHLVFEDVQKYDKTKNKYFSFERKSSHFKNVSSGEKSYEVQRYFAKADDHFYIIYAWQESSGLLNSTAEKSLYEMVNSIGPL